MQHDWPCGWASWLGDDRKKPLTILSTTGRRKA